MSVADVSSTTTPLTPRQLILAALAVLTGGALGTLCRILALDISHLGWYARMASNWGWYSVSPSLVILLIVNALGVFGATWALTGPLRKAPSTQITRLVVITGFFGGFTSYSSLYVDLYALWRVDPWHGVVIGALAVLSGFAMAELAMIRRS